MRIAAILCDGLWGGCIVAFAAIIAPDNFVIVSALLAGIFLFDWFGDIFREHSK